MTQEKQNVNQNLDLHPPIDSIDSNFAKSEYKQASQDIETEEQLKLFENFVGTIHGEASQLEKSNVTKTEFTSGLKFDAKKEIVDARRDFYQKSVTNNGGQVMQTPPPVNQHNIPQPPPVPMNQPIAHPQVPVGDSLILKNEIDKIKEDIKDIKKLYNEFFKLKQVKGQWLINDGDKNVSAPSVSKAWHTINKLLKSKKQSFTVTYKEIDE